MSLRPGVAGSGKEERFDYQVSAVLSLAGIEQFDEETVITQRQVYFHLQCCRLLRGGSYLEAVQLGPAVQDRHAHRLVVRLFGPGVDAEEVLAGLGDLVRRVQEVPALVEGKLSKDDADRRWRHLADSYFAQQLACYPIDYLEGEPSADRILETVERYEEDLTDAARVHRPMRCTIDVGDAIVVSPERPRGGDGDPVMKQLEQSLSAMLAASAPGPWKG